MLLVDALVDELVLVGRGRVQQVRAAREVIKWSSDVSMSFCSAMFPNLRQVRNNNCLLMLFTYYLKFDMHYGVIVV